MTYRGTFRGGVIVPGDSLDLPEGARVDFSILRTRGASPSNRSKRVARRIAKRPTTRMTAAQRVEAFMQGFALLRNSPGLRGKSSALIARDLRRRATGARFRG